MIILRLNEPLSKQVHLKFNIRTFQLTLAGGCFFVKEKKKHLAMSCYFSAPISLWHLTFGKKI